MAQFNPLNIEELLGNCMQYHHDSPSTLKACALVARSWVYAAQSHLFRAPIITHWSSTPAENALTWTRFIQTLHSSPHLIRHIRRLRIGSGMTANELPTLREIWTFQFTHLETVSLTMYRSELSLDSVVPLQQFLSLPTLRRLILHCSFGDWGLFVRLWDHCSPSLREIAFHCDQEPRPDPPPSLLPSHRGSTIPLESLYLGSVETLDYRLMRTPSLFDLSHLRILCIGWRSQISWSDFGPLVRNIQALSIVANARATAIDLGSFPNLTSLRVFLPPWITTKARLTMATQLFSGITSANVIRSIVVATETATLDGHVCTTLDTVLSALPVLPPPKVKFELNADEYEGIWPYFVRLNSTNSLGRVQDLANNWWELTRQD